MTPRVVNNDEVPRQFTAALWELSAKQEAELRILEAGCGRRWALRDRPPLTLTGVDIDEDALRIRKELERDLDVGICADIRDPSAAVPNSFDVVYSVFVLEHMPNAERALENFVSWLRPGGVLLLQFPDPKSVLGWLTRRTPFVLHLLTHRLIYRFRHAGRPGYGPYRTFYDKILEPAVFKRFCADHGLVVQNAFATDRVRIIPVRLIRSLMRAFVRTISLIALGRLEWRYNNLAYIVTKPASVSAKCDLGYAVST